MNKNVSFYPLTFVSEIEGVSIGRFGTDQFAVFPEDGAELVKKLQAGFTPSDAAQWYRETYNEDVDMEDFIGTLQELGFLREDSEEVAPLNQVAWQKVGQFAFSPWGWGLYLLLFLGSVFVMIRFPTLLPHRQNVFFSSYVTVIELGLFIGQLPGIIVHEFFHMLAARSKGIPARLGIGRRMYYVVAEASMPGLFGLPRKERYLPLLAGMVGDVVWFSFLTLLAGLLIGTNSADSLAVALAFFLRALAFTTILRFLWQFYFYLQTDIYYVLMTLLGCVNLQAATKAFLRNQFFRLLSLKRKMKPTDPWSTRDLQNARWYSVFYSVGWLFSMGMLVVVMIPIAYQFLSMMVRHLLNSTQHQTFSFWDSVIFILLNLMQVGLLGFVFLKERKNRRLRAVQNA